MIKYNNLVHRRNEIREIAKRIVFFRTDKNRCECWHFGITGCGYQNTHTKTVYKDNVAFTICPNIIKKSKFKFSLGELNGEIVHIME